MVVAMVGAMGLLWLLPWDCYDCCYGIAMVATMVVAIIAAMIVDGINEG